MRIATWNVNSLKARMDRVEEWIGYAEPDVLCLQETKMADKAFPAMAFSALGYDSVHHGEGRWNGVAILSRVGIDDVVAGFAPGIEPDRDARLLTATCGGIRVLTVYVPNGREVGHDHYHYKLDWMRRLREHLETQAKASEEVVVCGDFNIAPDDRDVWDPDACSGGTHVSASERAALADVVDWGLVDVFRRQYQADRLYTWWDYRAGMFHKHMGMRIDLMYATESLADRLEWTLIDRNARKGVQPSDHAPLVSSFRERV